MATVARLLPRFWDGRRLLQFLTGLALIALAFAVPAFLDAGDQATEAPVTVITTVDTPLPPGLPLSEAPERTSAAAADSTAGLALEARSAEAAAQSTEAAGSTEAAAQDAEAAARAGDNDPQGAAPVDAGAVQGPAGLPVQGRHGGLICVESRAAGGSTQRAHGERGPPRA